MLTLALLLLVPQSPETNTATPGPDNLGAWMRAIEPDDTELSFQKVGWRNQLTLAIDEARQLGRPILLWTMNGHPLGCT